MSSSEESLLSGLRIALCILCERLGWAYGEAWIPSGLDSLRLSGAFHCHTKEDILGFRKKSESLVFRPNFHCLPGRVLSMKQPEWCEDVRKEPPDKFMRVQAAMEAGFAAALALPLFSDAAGSSCGQVLAILVLFAHEARPENKAHMDEACAFLSSLSAAEWMRPCFSGSGAAVGGVVNGSGQTDSKIIAPGISRAPLSTDSRPRVLVVSRRLVRKNKYVDFVGEYHLDLLLRFGAVPIILPRVAGTLDALDQYEPMHGLLSIEGEDIDTKFLKDSSYQALSPKTMDKMSKLHSSDIQTDTTKDEIELELFRRALQRGVPCFGICRGCQLLNVSCGGSIYQDVMLQKGSALKHIDYHSYDSYRHAVTIEKSTPLYEWYGQENLMVNSYHHQGVRRLASNLKPMAFASDNLIEAFYDPNHPFRVGLQFHPERMQGDHPGHVRPFQAFVKACRDYFQKVQSVAGVRRLNRTASRSKLVGSPNGRAASGIAAATSPKAFGDENINNNFAA